MEVIYNFLLVDYDSVLLLYCLSAHSKIGLEREVVFLQLFDFFNKSLVILFEAFHKIQNLIQRLLFICLRLEVCNFLVELFILLFQYLHVIFEEINVLPHSLNLLLVLLNPLIVLMSVLLY